jgi:hypothetical protein
MCRRRLQQEFRVAGLDARLRVVEEDLAEVVEEALPEVPGGSSTRPRTAAINDSHGMVTGLRRRERELA